MNGIFTSIVIIIGGLFLVIKGADYLVEGSSSIARRFGVKPIVIGLTIVAFGTSMPELVVNLFASAQGQAGLAVGNIIGSNISNILLILGISAIIVPLKVGRSTVTKEIPFALLSIIVLWFMVWDGMLDRADGLILLSFFIIFLYYTFGISRVEGTADAKDYKRMSNRRSTILILVGIAGLAIGGKFTVDGAKDIASFFNISEDIIGLTIVAIGSSLPELATSVVAARKKEVDIAIGNIVGSNIFNILWVFGLSALIRELPFPSISSLDVLIAIGVTVILLAVLFIGKRNILERWEGYMFLLIYASYLVFLVMRYMASA